MKRRGLRVTLTAGAIGLAVVAVVVAFNWGVVRDHVEAWWFQATTETETLQPKDVPKGWPWIRFRLLVGLSQLSQRPVIIESTMPWGDENGIVEGGDTAVGMLQALRANGFRIIEQRFPRRAYVVVGYPVQEQYKIRDPIFEESLSRLPAGSQ
jgi:hypothetical protein